MRNLIASALLGPRPAPAVSTTQTADGGTEEPERPRGSRLGVIGRVLLQVAVMQLAMYWLTGFNRQNSNSPPVDTITGKPLPPYKNIFQTGSPFDIYFHLSHSPTKRSWRQLFSEDRLVYVLTDETYTYRRFSVDRQFDVSFPITEGIEWFAKPSLSVSDVLAFLEGRDEEIERLFGDDGDSSGEGIKSYAQLRQLLRDDCERQGIGRESPMDDDDTAATSSSSSSSLSSGCQAEYRRERIRMLQQTPVTACRSTRIRGQHPSVYLVVTAVPHTAYRHRPKDFDLGAYFPSPRSKRQPSSPPTAHGDIVEIQRALLQPTHSGQSSAGDSGLLPTRSLVRSLELPAEKGSSSRPSRPPLAPDAISRLAVQVDDRPSQLCQASVNLVTVMPPFSAEETQFLLGHSDGMSNSLSLGEPRANSASQKPNPSADKSSSAYNKEEEESRHWKSRVDVGLIYDTADHYLYHVKAGMPLKGLDFYARDGTYHPKPFLSDFWMIEKDYVRLNETLIHTALNLTVHYNCISGSYFLVQQQMAASFQQQKAFKMQSRRESFMLKRILLETNPLMLAFSAVFMLLHMVFSFFAFKNDVQFWYHNQSMQGLSATSVVVAFVCEVIIALYLFESQKTSWLILFEISMGIVISAWKVTKAVKFTTTGSFPFIRVSGAKNYVESNTKQYDKTAIKYMSIVTLPCVLGYAIYSLYYYKYRSWYSYVLSVLAGVVYTFGFIMMTPQLYINYKLKSVDHLPWKALIYKSLNTFVDDIASFLIDMPWMHRLSCFRDDIIFFAYLYQRWIYKEDKNRVAEWMGKGSGVSEQEEEESAGVSSAEQREVKSATTHVAAAVVEERRLLSGDNEEELDRQQKQLLERTEGGEVEREGKESELKSSSSSITTTTICAAEAAPETPLLSDDVTTTDGEGHREKGEEEYTLRRRR